MQKIKVPMVSLAAALLAGMAVGGAAVAAASDGPPPPPHMNISAAGGDGTAVDSDGTQGSFTNSVQGTADTDGDQDARDFTSPEMATDGQLKSPNKMTK